MLYSASRTMHMLSATLPAGLEILAVIALAAFDLGLIAWLIIFLRGAAGGLQRGIALLMIVVDLLGVIVGFLGDTLMTSGDTGLLEKMAQGDKQTIIMLTAFVIAINIAGAVFYHMADPDNLRRMTEEAAKDKITGQALKAIETQASILANELAPQIAADWVDQMRADFTAALGSRNAPQIAQPAPAPLPALPTPTKMNPILAMFSKAAGQQPAAQTMASDGVVISETPAPTRPPTRPATPQTRQEPAREDTYPLKTDDGMRHLRVGESFTVDHDWTNYMPRGGTQEMRAGTYTYDGAGFLSYNPQETGPAPKAS
jgi:hypothetical protein